MADFRQKDADLEFRRGLEELVRGHLDGCMTAFSSSRGGVEEEGASGDGGPDQLVRRRRRSDLVGDDLAESSAAARRHSRILSRWVARQAEEMITTIERRNRESELMALAGLHTVSMLDSSFLRESRLSPSSVERPVAARAPSILQMWRELEDMSAPTERRSAAPALEAGSRNRAESRERELRGSSEDASESDYTGYDRWARGTIGSTGRPGEEEEEDRGSSREQSPDIGDGERERVRQIVSGWMTENGMGEAESRVSPRNESPTDEWLGEIERERVRLAREWVQMVSQQRDARDSRTVDRDRDGSVTDLEEGQPEHLRRDLLRLRGRQARLELIMRVARERQRELQSLSEHRVVSEFAHRNRIQSLLRGRFLRNGGPSEERPPSVAAQELGQLRQRHPVSGLREGFHFGLENIVRGQAINRSDTSATQNMTVSRNNRSQLSTGVELLNDNHEQSQLRSENIDIHQSTETHETAGLENSMLNEIVDMQESANQVENWQEEDIEHERREWQQSTEGGYSDWHEETGEESDENWHENMEQEWSRESPEDEDGEDSHLLEVHEEWHEDESHEDDEHSDPPRGQRPIPIRRVNRFNLPDDDNVYSMELRELLSRRSVSNLLRSGFRESLDQLIQSYVQQQARAPLDWDLHRTLPTTTLPEENQDQHRDDADQDLQDSVPRPPPVLLPPPFPPRQPLWHSALHHSNWTRQSLHRSEIEWDIINDLRADMARLQQGMSHMQRMFEACMDMQLELQRSIRQEVSAALNCSAGGQGHVWTADQLIHIGGRFEARWDGMMRKGERGIISGWIQMEPSEERDLLCLLRQSY
ncbi:zinc finger CCCH domain-containing protein 13-like isoform X2 [Phoenix dactylifera]|uniref:Zinc finger CCCH domain-containing protein 13-like isoform X2 n=1 Tax=Phoenix dactylifera TaxID=42345 RepID=A0A8B7BJY4_PHODC|nr:zinc finger CCCH domain-containing protein 13-like isoform X2 [Phoenix dactylifera]